MLTLEQRQLIEADKAISGRGYARLHPDGTVERIPPEQMLIFAGTIDEAMLPEELRPMLMRMKDGCSPEVEAKLKEFVRSQDRAQPLIFDSEEQPECTGRLTHDEYTFCPRHDK